MRRRFFGFALSTLLLALCFPAQAQQATKGYRIGLLAFGPPPPEPLPATFPFWAFRQALRDLKYLENQNLVLESRWAAGKREQLPVLAAELVRLNVDIIVASGLSAVQAAKNATRTVPDSTPLVYLVLCGFGSCWTLGGHLITHNDPGRPSRLKPLPGGLTLHLSSPKKILDSNPVFALGCHKSGAAYTSE